MNTISRSKPLLGTFVEISLSADVLDDELLAASTLAYAEIERIQNLMSFHDSDSELSTINKNAYEGAVPISRDTTAVLNHAQSLSRLTRGLYDIAIGHDLMRLGGLPQNYKDSEAGNWQDFEILGSEVSFKRNIKIDLGGIAKGYAVDCAASALTCCGTTFEQITINAGGDIWMLNWHGQHVNVRHPNARKRNSFCAIEMASAALATSAPNHVGRNSLIINPVSREYISSTNSISVFAPSCMVADALTKAVFLSSDPNELLMHFSASAVCIDSRGNMQSLGVTQ